MGSADIYHDSDGNECSLLQAVHREPQWAVSRIQEGEKAIERVIELEVELFNHYYHEACGNGAGHMAASKYAKGRIKSK